MCENGYVLNESGFDNQLIKYLHMKQAILFIALIFFASAFTIAQIVADPQQCIEEKCPTQWAACQKDSKCVPALQDCEKKCGTSKSCWTLCLPSKGSQAAVDVAKCADANKCLGQSAVMPFTNPQDCIQKYCKNEEQACENDRRCIGVLNFCDDRCNTSLTCWKDCVDRSKDTNASNYFNCVIKNNCYNSTNQFTALKSTVLAVFTPEECINQHCKPQGEVCFKDQKCLIVLQDCEKECQNDQSCWSTCVSKKGNANASAFWQCIVDNDCLNKVEQKSTALVADPQACIEEKCPNQWAACQKDPKCVPALQDCEKKCGTSQSCWTFCLPGKGSQAAVDTAKCAAKNKCV